MTDNPTDAERTDASAFAEAIGKKVARKRNARRHPAPTAWLGLGMMGLIGWSVVVPTLLGAALGIWLDKRHAGTHSWTLALLMAGLALGCLNAWRWVANEDADMHDRPESGGA